MKIAVLSDIHDNIWNLEKAIKKIKKTSCKAVIFCGDLCAPFTAENLKRVNTKIYAVSGNVDADPWTIAKKGGENFITPPAGQDFFEIDLAGRKIAFCHYPALANMLFRTKFYDAVFHGHSHIYYQKKKDGRVLANPGAVCGIIKGKPGQATFMMYETDKNDIQLVNI